MFFARDLGSYWYLQGMGTFRYHDIVVQRLPEATPQLPGVEAVPLREGSLTTITLAEVNQVEVHRVVQALHDGLARILFS